MSGLYIHIPFCKSRCIYCDFYSDTHHQWQDAYVDALCREMELRRGEITDIETVYLGGGTPSLLSACNLRRLFTYIYKVYEKPTSALRGEEKRSPHPLYQGDGIGREVTIECNPDDVTPAFAQLLKALPINRVSLGMQTFSDERLRFLRRRHTAAQSVEAVRLLREAGIGNISIDLIYGYPDQTLDNVRHDLGQVLSLNVEHVSAYHLTYEDHTPLGRMRQAGDIKELPDEVSVAMYETFAEQLTAHGYEHYEISNFARPGYRSLHNSNYWNGTHYIGIGAAAHSYNGTSRQWNVANIRRYIHAIEDGRVPCEAEPIDEATRYNDAITTTLRTSDGLAISSLPPQFHAYLTEQAAQHINQGLLEIHEGHLRLTPRAIMLSDAIMADLIYLED